MKVANDSAPSYIHRPGVGAEETVRRYEFCAAETQVFSTTRQPPYKHHTTSIEPTKDKSLCSNKVTSENDAESAQKLGLLQPSAFS